jgi:ribonucleoside-diphosphate reductase alpha chain
MPTRIRLPDRRECTTFDVRHGAHAFQVTFGLYPDHTVGEVFISGGKVGSELEAVTRDSAILISLALQHGVRLDVVRHAITRNADGSPSSIIGAVLERLAAR